jgi:helicase MOV-10
MFSMCPHPINPLDSPGTGKTVTIVEAILQLLKEKPDARIFAIAPSNSAADLIALRLKSLGSDVLFRLYAPSRHKDIVPDILLDFTYRTINGHFSIPLLSRLRRFKVIVSTAVSASVPYGVGIPRGHFTHIFVDEAGQASEPEVRLAFRMRRWQTINSVVRS